MADNQKKTKEEALCPECGHPLIFIRQVCSQHPYQIDLEEGEVKWSKSDDDEGVDCREHRKFICSNWNCQEEFDVPEIVKLVMEEER